MYRSLTLLLFVVGCSSSNFAGGGLTGVAQNKTSPKPAGDAGAGDANDGGEDNDGGDSAVGDADGLGGSDEGDAEVDGGDVGDSGESSGGDGKSSDGDDLQVDTVELTGKDNYVTYVAPIGLNLAAPVAAGIVAPADGFTRIKALGKRAVTSGVGGGLVIPQWRMWVKRTAIVMVTDDTHTLSTSSDGRCSDDEVAVGMAPIPNTSGAFPLICASLKPDYETYDSVTMTKSWTINTSYQCPGQSVLVGQTCAPNRCEGNGTTFTMHCAKIRRK